MKKPSPKLTPTAKGARTSVRFRARACNAIKLTCALFFTAFLARAADTKFSLPPETSQLKPGPGVELASANCSLCHSPDYINTQPRLTRTAWKAEVAKMQQKYGAPILTNNIEALTDYLTKSYGKDDPRPQPEKK